MVEFLFMLILQLILNFPWNFKDALNIFTTIVRYKYVNEDTYVKLSYYH